MVTRTKKIFVGGLSAPTTLEDVKSYFEQFGPVSTKKISKQLIKNTTTKIETFAKYVYKHFVCQLSK